MSYGHISSLPGRWNAIGSPGVFFIISLITIGWSSFGIDEWIIELLFYDHSKVNNISEGVLIVIIGICGVFSGLVIEHIADYFLDRVYIRTVHGYPNQRLLSDMETQQVSKDRAKKIQQAIFSSPANSNERKVLIVGFRQAISIYLAATLISAPLLALSYPNWSFIGPGLMAASLMAVILMEVAFPSARRSIKDNSKSHDELYLPDGFARHLITRKDLPGKLSLIYCKFIHLINWPLLMVHRSLTRFGLSKEFSSTFTKNYKLLMRLKYMGQGDQNCGTNYFWMAYCCLIKNANTADIVFRKENKMNFAKNLSTVFFFISISITCVLYFSDYYHEVASNDMRLVGILERMTITKDEGATTLIDPSGLSAIFAVAGICMLSRYVFLYVYDFNKTIFRLYYECHVGELNNLQYQSSNPFPEAKLDVDHSCPDCVNIR